jgi:hypothetical protein
MVLKEHSFGGAFFYFIKNLTDPISMILYICKGERYESYCSMPALWSMGTQPS